MEKRKARRHRVFKAGTIEFGRSAFSCVVRDRSDVGAKLDVPSLIGIPDQFVLVTDGSRYPAVLYGEQKDGSESLSINAASVAGLFRRGLRSLVQFVPKMFRL
jgi:hypothetical protein